ncbi:zinc finger domain-containing protein [Sarocladium implicatum]|nr:zinc finger domain-containing protein [Sarocladium implicatum]
MEFGVTQFTAAQPPAITTLPVELVRQVLSTLPDIDSLRSAALSCSFLYFTFIADEASIVEQVLINQLFLPLIPELLLAHRSSLLPRTADERRNRETFRDTVHQLLHKRRVRNLKLSLKEGLDLARLHALVEYFARKFAKSAIKTPSLSHTSEDHITYRESIRIRRAFYWFEIFCNYFRKLWREDEDSIFSVFGCMFAPWEAEQLACVHDYMARAIMPAFNDVAEHDVVWGASKIRYGHDVAPRGIQSLIPLGLAKLRVMIKAKTYEQRYKILDPCRTSRRRWPRMAKALRESYIHPSQCPADGGYPPPLIKDKDPGPRMIWGWAHWDEEMPGWTYQAHRDTIRRWGYVFWDKARLEEAISQQVWEGREGPDEVRERLEEERRQRE